MDPGLAGKWISPMHPEIVKEGPGACDICGMPLVRAETLGYVASEASESDRPLVIPASAALWTGKRAVVYVEVPQADPPAFEGREIALGPRAGGFYLVDDRLKEGERVVPNGNFKIDSALQILAKPSMMQPEEPAAGSGTPEKAKPSAPAAFQAQLRVLAERAVALQEALAAVGASFPVVFLMISLVMGVSMGANVVIAQNYGAKNYERLRAAVETTYLAIFWSSLVLTALGLLAVGPILDLLRVPDAVRESAAVYLRIIVAGLVFTYGYNGVGAVLRGLG
jgi:hypothetical protein